MPEPKAKKGVPAWQLISGLLFLAGSVGLFVRRMPNVAYVEAHADKPRPAAAAPQVPPPAQPAVKAAAPAPSVSLAVSAAPVSLEDACRAELGLLCYKVSEKLQRGCLGDFEDALRTGCREALSEP